jgi:two-component system sensor kinase FixL
VHTARDGGRLTVASRWALQRDSRGRRSAILETNNDITERRGVENRLHRASSELAHVSRVATLGELTASIAHEVNQPLAAIVANGEAGLRWLKRDVPDLTEVRNSVERMIRNGQRASEVVQRLRALARKSDPVHVPVAMADIVNEAALLVGRELLVHRATLSVSASAGLPRVRGDRVQLQQVVINLLINGIQAMDGVTDRERALSIKTDSVADGIVVTVSDNGPGIAAETLERLFEAFFSTKSDGMGMGLSICRSIVEAHGGRIWATNRDGAGASFHFSLPALQGGEA